MKRRGKPSHGVSYLEMLLVMLILALCTDFICNTMAFGFQHLRERAKRAYALILLDTLCAAVRNDLEYATNYDAAGDSFTRTVEGRFVITRYGMGAWQADDPQSHYDADTIQWRGIAWRDSSEEPFENPDRGQIIRKSKLINGDFFDCAAPPECYSGYGEAKSGLCAGLDIEYVASEGADREIQYFNVSIRIYDAPDTDANLLAQRVFSAFPVQPIPIKSG